MEVYDSAGGGDVVYLPGDFSKLNVEGYIWIPQSSVQPWSTGIGVGTRAESAWFSSTTGFGMEHGLYLEYQNGPGLGLKGGRIADAAGLARLIVADSSQAAGMGNNGFTATSMGVPATPLTSSWQRFRLFMDGAANRVYAKVGDNVIFDGPLPASLTGVSGGVTIGFRENHAYGPDTQSREGTWVDHIAVDTNTSTESAIGDYYLY